MQTSEFRVSQQRDAAKFPVAEAREIVSDLMRPSPILYWSDFLFHVFLGWGAFYLAVNASGFSLPQAAWYLVSILSLFRAAVFIHELTHLNRNSFGLFRVVWNLLCGFPLLIPSFLYQGVHNEHHRQDLYGTRADGEYRAFAAEGRWSVLAFLGTSLMAPLFFSVRFVLLAPISRLNGSLRSMILKRASAFSIDPAYTRSPDSLNAVPGWAMQEFAAGLYGWVFLIAVLSGKCSPDYLIGWYCVTAAVFFVNALRTLAAHRYGNPAHREMDFSGQLQDSINIPDNLFAVLWAPVGLRFHAAHHLIPDLPYHSLGKAHQRLLERFSEKKLYERCTCRGLWSALRRLWREAGA